jgi:hypothetical protein
MGRREMARIPSPVAWALMFRWPFESGEPSIIRVPLAQVAWRKDFGWRLLIRDDEMPTTQTPPVMDLKLLSRQKRRAWLNEEDIARERDDAADVGGD